MKEIPKPIEIENGKILSPILQGGIEQFCTCFGCFNSEEPFCRKCHEWHTKDFNCLNLTKLLG